MARYRDMTGMTFGLLTIVAAHSERSTEGRVRWIASCACGNEVVRPANDYRPGRHASCGCRRKPDEGIGYNAAHARVERVAGPASQHACADCGQPARDWSLRHGAVRVLTDIDPNGYTRRYSPNPGDYEPRCKLCHAAYDRRREAA